MSTNKQQKVDVHLLNGQAEEWRNMQAPSLFDHNDLSINDFPNKETPKSRINKILKSAYTQSKTNGEVICFGQEGIDCSELISPKGALRQSFTLPIGEPLGADKGIGIKDPCSSPKLHEIKFSQEENGYWADFPIAESSNKKGIE